MKEETKKALSEMQEAVVVAKALHHFGKIDTNELMHRYDGKTVIAMEDADRREKKAKVTYHTLSFQELDWKRGKIDEWLKREGLK